MSIQPGIQREVIGDGWTLTASTNSSIPDSFTTEVPQIVVETDNDVGGELIETEKSFTYLCTDVVEDNTPTLIPTTFFMDLAFPKGAEDLALKHVQDQLVTNIASQYRVTDGFGCDNPIPTGRWSWVIQISSELKDWVRHPVSDSCKELTFDESSEECFAYQAKVTSGVLMGDGADVVAFIQSQLDQGEDGSAEPVTQNSPYHVQFLGLPLPDPGTGGNSDRDDLGTPTSVPTGRDGMKAQKDGNNFTTIEVILIGAFCIAGVLGVALIIYRRRQEWRLEESDAANYGSSRQDQRHGSDDDEYGQSELRRDLYGADNHLQMDRNGKVRRTSRDDSELEKITIDMGSMFKHQLMGVYGSSAARRGLHQQQHQQRNSLYAGGSGVSESMDSEADSWAQTDGTIGSIDQNLDLITSEV